MIKSVIFDIGAVLIDWNPRYLYRKLMTSDAEVETFLRDVCTFDWNHSLDLDRPWDDARADAADRFPNYTSMIDAYWHRWDEMLNGPIHESVDILMDLKRRGIPLYALSNFNSHKFQEALAIFPFLRLFDGRIVSGEVGQAKPDVAIYHTLLDRFNLNPRETLFIDDRKENVQAAWDVGMNAVQFLNPAQLESDLIEYGLIAGPDLGTQPSHHHCGCDGHHDGADDHDEDSRGACCGGGCGCH